MMISNGKSFAGLIALTIGAASWLAAADFIAPAEGPVAFRRDKLPLEAEAMASLSHHLDILARGLAGQSPEERHGAAQMLALSLALDPSNTKARETLREFQQKRHQPLTDVTQLERSRAKVWQMTGWLETPDAGRQGQALANCLKDVIVISDPKHPKAEAIIAAGAKGEWEGWVPALSAYQNSANRPDKGAQANNPNDLKEPPGKTPDKPNDHTLKQAKIDTVLWKNTGTAIVPKWVYAPASLQMTSKTIDPNTEDPEPFPITIGDPENMMFFAKSSQMLSQLMSIQSKKIPNNFKVNISSVELLQSVNSNKKQSISAAAAVLASAAINGIEPNAMIIGTVDETGAFKLPSGFWNQIRCLGKGSGKRLVLPTEAATLMPALLAMENPVFFIDYEVLLAADFKQLLTLSAKTPDSAFLPALAKFQEIRTKSAGQEIRQYIANPYVRKRLAEISQEAPYHLSSKMLLIQSEGKRPTLITRKVLASELRRAIEPMAWIGENQPEETLYSGIPKMMPVFDTCRTSVDAMERYIEKNDRNLFEETRDLINGIRTVEKASRTRVDGYYVGREYAREPLMNLILKWDEVTAMLAREAGEPAPPPALRASGLHIPGE